MIDLAFKSTVIPLIPEIQQINTKLSNTYANKTFPTNLRKINIKKLVKTDAVQTHLKDEEGVKGKFGGISSCTLAGFFRGRIGTSNKFQLCSVGTGGEAFGGSYIFLRIE